jgi:hypothetical protein
LAGFYFDPSEESPDSTTCYLCRKELDGWEAEDDPWIAHVRHGKMHLSELIRILGKVPRNRKTAQGEFIKCPLTTLEFEESRLVTFRHWPNPLENYKATPKSVNLE